MIVRSRGLFVLLLLALFPVAASSAPIEPPPAFLAKWGTGGSAEGQFTAASGVAVDGMGNVYSTELSNNRVQVFDRDGTFLRMWGMGVQDGSSAFQICTSGCQAGLSGSGDGHLNEPLDLAVDAAGNVYVTDTLNYRVQVFTSNGTFLRTWGWGVDDGSDVLQTCTSGCQAGISGNGDGQLGSPEGIEVDGSGNLFVVDDGFSRIQVFDNNGAFLRKWGSGGSGDGQFAAPQGIGIGPLGDVYVVEMVNNRVQRFNSTGDFLGKWGSACDTSVSGIEGCDGLFDWPEGLSVDSAGNVYVVDSDNHRIQKFDSHGNFLSKWGTLGAGDGEFWWPKDVAVLDAGYIYVIEHGNKTIQKFGGPWLDVFVGQPLPRPE